MNERKTLSQRIEEVKFPKVVSKDDYVIIDASIYNYNGLSIEEKKQLSSVEGKMAEALLVKFNALLVYINAGKIIIVFDKKKHSHYLQGFTHLITGAINSYLVHLYYDIVPNIWFIVTVFGENDKKKVYAYILYSFRKSIKRTKVDYLLSFDKDEMKPVQSDTIQAKLDYTEDLCGIGYDVSENFGTFAKFTKKENPDSKFGFDKKAKSFTRDIYFREKDIEYIMSPFL